MELHVSGPDGAPCLVFCHGWPDTAELWQTTTQALQAQYRCVRFTWPGFEAAASGRAYSLAELSEHLHQVVLQANGGRPVTLVLHDWGCVFGYHFAQAHPQLVQRVVGLDIGDAGSSAHRRSLTLKPLLMIAGYQLWLALAWKLGSNRMARKMAALLRAPARTEHIHAAMGYPYWLAWTGGLKAARPFKPQVPMFFGWAKRKPFMFHSQEWADGLNLQAHSKAVGYRAGHWLMLDAAQAFQTDLLQWLQATEPA